MSKSFFKKLPRSFFRRPATELAPALLGKILVRQIHGKAFQARVVETEAYLGPHDLASHASKGRTRRTEVLFGPRMVKKMKRAGTALQFSIAVQDYAKNSAETRSGCSARRGQFPAM